MLRPESPVETHKSEPDPETGEQYLLRLYHGNGPVIRTVARRVDGGTWGPEHILFATPAGDLGAAS